MNDAFQTDEMLLDGHLNITKELLQFQSPDKKHWIGCQQQGNQLINDLIEYFILPASCLFKKYRDTLLAVSNMRAQHAQSSPGSAMNISINSETINALNSVEQMLASKSLKSICSSSMTTSSAYELLVALCNGCLPNFNMLSDLLFQLFYPSLIPGNNPANHNNSRPAPAGQTMSLDFSASR